MRNAAFDTSVAALSELGPMRVWSVIVTVFGDLTQHRPMDGPTLSMLMDQIGIKPEATRVALHRLRSDGWIASTKAGRTSLHSLTEKGQRDSAAAGPRIYGRPDQMGRGTQVVVTEDVGASLDPAHFAQIAPRVFVAGADAMIPLGAMRLQTEHLPPWLGAQIETPAMRDSYKALHAVLLDIDGELPSDAGLTALQIAVLRMLIVHAWRRLALKHPDLPRLAHSADWRGHDCRALVTALLDRFERPTLDAIKAV